MSSPFTPDEKFNSYNGNKSWESEFDKSLSFGDNSMQTEQRKMESAIEQATESLKLCLTHYEEKASNCEHRLEQLGLCVKDFPDDLKMDLKNVFKDGDGVFNFPVGRGEMAVVNANHVLESLQEKHELGQLQLLTSQMESLVEEYQSLQNNLQRKLNAEKEAADKLDNKRLDKEVNLMIFRGKLEEANLELKHLQQLSQGVQKPKYTLDDIENFKEEIRKLENEIAITSVQLSKYNKLPINEKEAKKQLDKMIEELKIIDDEIKRKVKNSKK